METWCHPGEGSSTVGLAFFQAGLTWDFFFFLTKSRWKEGGNMCIYLKAETKTSSSSFFAHELSMLGFNADKVEPPHYSPSCLLTPDLLTPLWICRRHRVWLLSWPLTEGSSLNPTDGKVINSKTQAWFSGLDSVLFSVFNFLEIGIVDKWNFVA